MDRRSFLPALGLLPVAIKQIVKNISIAQHEQYNCLFDGRDIWVNGVKHRIVQYDSSTGVLTVDKWQAKPEAV